MKQGPMVVERLQTAKAASPCVTGPKNQVRHESILSRNTAKTTPCAGRRARSGAERGQAVIAIKAAALNFFEILISRKIPDQAEFPFSPAAEVAGVIERVGAGSPT